MNLIKDVENVQRFGLINVYWNMKELFYQNNDIHFGPIWLVLYKNLGTGFLLGIFFRGGKSIVMQISFVMLLFSDQISGRGRSFQGDKLPQGAAPAPPPPVEESQGRAAVTYFYLKYHKPR